MALNSAPTRSPHCSENGGWVRCIAHVTRKSQSTRPGCSCGRAGSPLRGIDFRPNGRGLCVIKSFGLSESDTDAPYEPDLLDKWGQVARDKYTNACVKKTRVGQTKEIGLPLGLQHPPTSAATESAKEITREKLTFNIETTIVRTSRKRIPVALTG